VIAFCRGVVSHNDNCKVIHSDFCDRDTVKKGRMNKFLQLLRPWNPYAIFPRDEYKANVVRNALLKKKYDLVVTRYIPKAMECGLLEYAAKLVIDVDDHPANAFNALSYTAKTSRNRFWHRLMSVNARLATNRILKRVQFSFFPDPSQVYYQRSACLPNIMFYEDISCPEPDFQHIKNRILFVGNLDYSPNHMGIDHFLKHIYTQVIKDINDLEFHIAGKISDPDYKQRWESFKGVRVLGYVDDLQNEYSQCRVVVVPVYHGGGTNIKLIEALHMKRACVVSRFATRGYNDTFEHNNHYLVANNDDEFYQCLIEIMTDELKNKTLAINGHYKVRQYFSYSSFASIVKNSLICPQ
jgi:glycosyltransferase involved in cell wall biosynthesis